MQKRNETVLGDIDGVYVIADDIIVAAKNEKEHDAIMFSLLKRAKEKCVCFNGDKMQFKVNSVRHMGHLVTEHGLKPDDEKINTIVNMPPPTNVPSAVNQGRQIDTWLYSTNKALSNVSS